MSGGLVDNFGNPVGLEAETMAVDIRLLGTVLRHIHAAAALSGLCANLAFEDQLRIEHPGITPEQIMGIKCHTAWSYADGMMYTEQITAEAGEAARR